MDEEPVKISALVMKYGLKPMKMIVREPILIVMTIYVSLVYGKPGSPEARGRKALTRQPGILYLIFFAFPISYEIDRGMEPGKASLP